ncbi:putative 3-ketoacyl-CoA thiolase, peroxisomal isoform X1 [Apostichopus japonicus]|uniref:Putative 3-ketoacyl-CoA thiolase, peroxisomal isoform X1 n=1 Tax=Stichopus japonicus TaxID=307972 RepID=A0A2G8JN17_STIJA|nr:putative 3-ketoacyl-CoA thiolase, peroxisomal isoform X1 [Apostichopus japonicus]
MERFGTILRQVARTSSAGQSTLPGTVVTGQPTRGFSSVTVSDEDIVILSALRTPIGKANKGMLKDTPIDVMLSTVLDAVLDQTKVNPEVIGDIVVGNVSCLGSGALLARTGMFFSGFPHTVPTTTVNRQCASGLQAFATAAGQIQIGAYDIAIAGGMESMSLNKQDGMRQYIHEKIMENEKAQACLLPMGITSENVASRYNIGREEQDRFALQSQQKAARAQSEGWFDAEIVPVTTMVRDMSGMEQQVTISKDEGVRAKTTLAGLAKLKPAFIPDGCSTAGNSSQVSDGAAAVLLSTRAKAKQLNLPVLGKFVSYAVVGVPPDIMGVGPAYAIPEAVKKAGLTLDDIDIFEINEAFASQAVWCVNELGIPKEKVNPKGGAIALGHPLGCTGARMIATLLHELKRRGKPGYGVVSMCMGTGMGAAAVFHYPGI